ncbi:hypothetical protein OIU77_003225 [Salix suchowensis]|uniref:Uncharacterized protein n=1 Tax=Salix suchowensis TaxID=1278906 RepID=A0ABQ9B105_9ROSI|nr:hypothetical protein OIU77_003225 [Salix suchowensis]
MVRSSLYDSPTVRDYSWANTLLITTPPLVQAPYGDHWRNLRRIGAIEIFSTHRINKFVSIRKDEIKQLLIRLSQNSLQNFGKVELKPLFQELTFNIMMRMVAGKRYYGDGVTDEEEAQRFREIMREAVSFGGASNPGDFLPILNWIDGGEFVRKVTRLGQRMDMFLQGLVDEHKRKGEGFREYEHHDWPPSISASFSARVLHG